MLGPAGHWYVQKHEPGFEDMLAKLRRTIIAARFTPVAGDPPAPDQIRDYTLARAAAPHNHESRAWCFRLK